MQDLVQTIEGQALLIQIIPGRYFPGELGCALVSTLDRQREGFVYRQKIIVAIGGVAQVAEGHGQTRPNQQTG